MLFETLEDLYALDWVQVRRNASWHDHFEISYRWSNFIGSRSLLMDIHKDGTYWVVGFIDDATNIDLPEWQGEHDE